MRWNEYEDPYNRRNKNAWLALAVLSIKLQRRKRKTLRQILNIDNWRVK